MEKLKQGNPVADDWAGAVMRKLLGIQKCDGRMDGPTDRPTDRPTDGHRAATAAKKYRIDALFS